MLQHEEFRAIFKPVISEIIQLVKDQISRSNTNVKAVLLVGGLESNAYLKDHLKIAVVNGIVVMHPPNAWLAVVLGAVMKGYQASIGQTMVSITSRLARKHYGIELHVQYDEGLHHSIRGKR